MACNRRAVPKDEAFDFLDLGRVTDGMTSSCRTAAVPCSAQELVGRLLPKRKAA